jgi:tetratricopeptide (TPR) repeat protein
MDEISQKVHEATRLIREERFDEAIALLGEVLRQDRNNVHAWWLVANAVDSPDKAHEALTRVLELDPDHAKAREMLDRLNELYLQEPADAAPAGAEPAETTLLEAEQGQAPSALLGEEGVPAAVEAQPPADVFAFPDESPAEVLAEGDPFAPQPAGFEQPEQPTADWNESPLESQPIEAGELEAEFEEPFAFEDLGGADFDFVPEEGEQAEEPVWEEREEKGGRRCLPVLLLLFLLLVVAVSAVVTLMVLNSQGGPVAPPAPTANPTLVVLNENHADALARVGAALAKDGLQNAGAAFRETDAGPALIGIFCWEQTGFSAAALEAMGIVTEQAAMLEDGLAAVGVELVLCDRVNDLLFSAITPLDQAMAYYFGRDSTEADFRATWVTGP